MSRNAQSRPLLRRLWCLFFAVASASLGACQAAPSPAYLTATALAEATRLTPPARLPTWTPTAMPMPPSMFTPSPSTTIIPPQQTPVAELPDRLVQEPVALDDLPVIEAQNAANPRRLGRISGPPGLSSCA